MESSATVDGGSDLCSLLVCTFHTIKARLSSLCSSGLCPEMSFLSTHYKPFFSFQERVNYNIYANIGHFLDENGQKYMIRK